MAVVGDEREILFLRGHVSFKTTHSAAIIRTIKYPKLLIDLKACCLLFGTKFLQLYVFKVTNFFKVKESKE